MGEFDELRGEGWRRLLAAARRRLDKTGGELKGSVALAYPTDEERQVLRREPGPHRIAVTLVDLDATLRQAYGVGLCKALAWLERPGQPEDLRGAFEAAMRCRHAGEGWFTGWLGRLSRDGTARRLVQRGDGDLLGWAAAVLDRLPAKDVPMPVLAEWATGDPTALSGTTLADLVIRALVLWQGAPPPVGREAERRIWADSGVLADDLASQVLVLGVRLTGEHPVAGWLAGAASAGMPFRLTLHQLMTGPVTTATGPMYVCANPVVLRAAAAELGADCAPLVCTEGRPSVACDRLLGAATGNRIHWHTDFDWPGLRRTAAAIERYDAVPWRMGEEDYLDALATGGSEPLEGTRALTPWDERLAATMIREHRAVREERLLPALLADLRPR
jgi:uncharacterized protein (TIGR02679 family)